MYEPVRISGPQEAYEFLRNVRNSDRESLYSIMLDACQHVIGCEEVSKGSLNTTRTSPRELYKSALLANAIGIIAAHNHPSGNIEPSADDIAFTRTVKKAGDLLGVELYDHLIVSIDGYTSLKDRGII